MALKITTQLLNDLRTSLQAAFSKGMSTGETVYQLFCSVIPSNSSKNTYPNLSQWPEFRKWVGPRQFKDLSATAYSIENETFESSVEVKREDIEDDNLGVSAHIAEASGIAAKVLPDELTAKLIADAHTALCYDGKPYFSADHLGKYLGDDENGDPTFAKQSNIVGDAAQPLVAVLMDTTKPFKPFIVQPRRDFALTAKFNANDDNVFHNNVFQYGSDGRVGAGYGPWQVAVAIHGALTPENYAKARAVLSGFVGDSGRLLGTRGTVLLIGPAQEAAALELLNADKIGNGKSNVWKGTAKLVINPYMQ